MNRFLSLISFVALSASLTLAQGTVVTSSRVEFCKVTNADGSVSSAKGAPLRVTIRKIKSVQSLGTATGQELNDLVERFETELCAPPPPPALPSLANVTVYQNDTGLFYVADQSPSVLDDLTLTASADGKPWKIVTFGIHFDSADRTGLILVRWLGWETLVGGQGPGVSAFEDLLFDFGFYLNRAAFPSTSSDFMLTVDLTLNPLAIVPNQTCYFAQQFREQQVPVEQGEGSFQADIWNVFADSGPQVGASIDLFWYDFPADGIYDETEPDNFGVDFPGAANFLLKVVVSSGAATTLNPSSYSWLRGVYQSGSLGSLWFDDGAYNVAKAGLTLFPSEPPAQLVVETFSPTSSPTAVRIDVDAHVNTTGLSMKIELWNFSTSAYVQVYSGAATTTDSTAVGFATVPSQYVSAGTMRAKVSFFRTGLTLLYPWSASVDMVKWLVTV